jgi:CRP-like cAMP-binding protein
MGMPSDTPPVNPDRGTLDDFLAADDIVPLPTLADGDWNRLRRTALRRIAWHFGTIRNLVAHRGRYLEDVIGFGWGGIFRSLRVGSIVTTSYRNEGHFRAGERIFGTSDFFSGAFRLPKSAADLEELVRVVNLRHHVAGVVIRQGRGVRVNAGYEADYAYVATAFIESLRRGYAACGVPPDSPRGRQVAAELCTILYQVAGLTGLARVPRDVAAHERFRDAYERRLTERPPSPRVRRMAQEIARRIAPLTAAMAGETVAGHVDRHFDRDTGEFLFPGGTVPPELDRQRQDWRTRLARMPALLAVEPRAAARRPIWQRPDIAALDAAYRAAPPDLTADRLIGAILLRELDAAGSGAASMVGATAGGPGTPLERRTMTLAPGEALIRQGHTIGEMYVLLATTAPLVVLRAADESGDARQLATLTAPTVLGEIGMWRGQPAVATVMSREPNRIDLLVIDAVRFAALKEEPGFRAATAAEVQRRLALNSALVGTLLDEAAARTGTPLFASIAQLFRYLTGDSHVALDAVVGLPDDATPADCVDALRKQVDEVIRAGSLPADLERYLGTVVATIG